MIIYLCLLASSPSSAAAAALAFFLSYCLGYLLWVLGASSQAR